MLKFWTPSLFGIKPDYKKLAPPLLDVIHSNIASG
jgi:hypothetical protein